MKLLGDRNWYLPRWLQWLPELDHEGGSGADAGAPRSRRGGAGGALPEPSAA
jgi:RND superfamily putative drug exporter